MKLLYELCLWSISISPILQKNSCCSCSLKSAIRFLFSTKQSRYVPRILCCLAVAAWCLLARKHICWLSAVSSCWTSLIPFSKQMGPSSMRSFKLSYVSSLIPVSKAKGHSGRRSLKLSCRSSLIPFSKQMGPSSMRSFKLSFRSSLIYF